MAIHRLLQHSAFSQDDIDRMVAAYEKCLKLLRLADRSDPADTAVDLGSDAGQFECHPAVR